MVQPADYPLLIGQDGPVNGKRWIIRGDVIIGRDETCDVVIQNRQVSRFHARLTVQDQGLVLEDLASKNGTFLNGSLVSEPVALQDGDTFQVALIQNFVYLNSDSTLPMELGSTGNVRVGKLFIDGRSRRIWIGKQELLPPLSVPQFRTLQTLYEQQGNVVSRQDIVAAAWGEDNSQGVSEQALDALVRRLRHRLIEFDPDHNYIITVRGHGLRLDNPSE